MRIMDKKLEITDYGIYLSSTSELDGFNKSKKTRSLTYLNFSRKIKRPIWNHLAKEFGCPFYQ